MSDFESGSDTDDDYLEVKKGINPSSVAVFVVIAVLSIMVGALLAMNGFSANSSTQTTQVGDSPFSPLAGGGTDVEIVLWNATARDSMSEVLRVLDLSELAEGDASTAPELDSVFYRMCRDIQGRAGDLYEFSEVPNESLKLLYLAWADAVNDVAIACEDVTEETVNYKDIDEKVAKSWSLFDSFFIGIQPFIEVSQTQNGTQ